MKENTYSPALKKNIQITRKGWDHLFQSKASKQRNIRDKISRMALLKAAKFIIVNTPKYGLNQENGESFYILDNIYSNKSKKIKVRVLLKQDSASKDFFFYSVMKI